MTSSTEKLETCVVIGASHAGVNFAFALRREGWAGDIILYDSDPELPYHRPPLSKTYLTSEQRLDLLKSAESYERERITLNLNTRVTAIKAKEKKIILDDDTFKNYDKLVIATGARPLMPPIPGLDAAKHVFALRSAADVHSIREALIACPGKKIVVIGGGYIGLEIAASLRKLGAHVTVLEREERVLARVTAPEMSAFFQELHASNGVSILTAKNVTLIDSKNDTNIVHCEDGSSYESEIIILGVGIQVNKELAENTGLTVENGIKVDASAKTNDAHIYAIGDCTLHYNPHYNRYIRLESVQNAVEQAKVAAAAISGKEPIYDTIPWFWSDQYDVKLQMVGLSEGYDQLIMRKEQKEQPCFSIWYFREERLLAVDAINNAKAYVIGTKFIKSGHLLNKAKLENSSVELKPANLLYE